MAGAGEGGWWARLWWLPRRAPPWVPHRGAVRRLGGVPAWGAERRWGGGVVKGYPTLTPSWVPAEVRYRPRERPYRWCDGGGDCANVERVRSRRGPHPGPTMDTASGCGKTSWRGGYRIGVRYDGCHHSSYRRTPVSMVGTAVGTAPTSSGSVVEGVPTRALPWIPHRGAVRRLGGGYRCGTTREGWGSQGDGVSSWGGPCPYVERVCSRRGPHPGPTVDTASGCGTTVGGWVPAWGAERRLPPRLTGENRYPWWCDGGGDCPTSSGSVVEGVPTRALPWIPHRGAVRRLGGGYRLGGRKDGYPIRLTGGRRYPWWCDGGGDCALRRAGL